MNVDTNNTDIKSLNELLIVFNDGLYVILKEFLYLQTWQY